MSTPAVVLTTVGGREHAERLAGLLVEQRLAACVNVVDGVLSVYRWQGAVQRDRELLLVIKTTRERFPALREALRAAHPYELPEMVLLEVADGLPAYLDWVREAVGES